VSRYVLQAARSAYCRLARRYAVSTIQLSVRRRNPLEIRCGASRWASLEHHKCLENRLIIDDPEAWAAEYPASERVHGTAMASLILHGDLAGLEQPLPRLFMFDRSSGPTDPIGSKALGRSVFLKGCLLSTSSIEQ